MRYIHIRDSYPRTWAVKTWGHLRLVGYSQCNERDQFSRKRGRQIAGGRAETAPRRSQSPNRFVMGFSLFGKPKLLDGDRSLFEKFLHEVPEHLYRRSE